MNVMKVKRVVEVTTSSYQEEQFILSRFPESLWFPFYEKRKFYIDEDRFQEVVDAVEEFNERSKG